MKSEELTIRQLIAHRPEGYTVGAYQRHYVWGQYREGEKDAVAYLTHCIVEAYRAEQPYFLQAITTYAGRLVDGQQRITYLKLLLHYLQAPETLHLQFERRSEAQQWLSHIPADISEDPDEASQDIYYYKRTLRTIGEILHGHGIASEDMLGYVLDRVNILLIELPAESDEVVIFNMMNGTKAPMQASDIIKADLMRLASDPRQPNAYDWELRALRARYASAWDSWVRWWNRTDVGKYFDISQSEGIALPVKLCLRNATSDLTTPLTYEEFRQYIIQSESEPYHSAKHFFHTLRRVQHRFEEAYANAGTYNRLKAIMLLQKPEQVYHFLHLYFVEAAIDEEELDRYYKLSFLGMTIEAITRGESTAEYFDDLLASLSMADVYHTDAKRDVFTLLLRLNIDEDTKLGRKFDFGVWSNRSLEHIYSKSRVWHTDENGTVLDGNDNNLHTSKERISRDSTYMPRSIIVNLDGTQLSEHCIGNLVLLYGENNAKFGNAGFEQKKQMFLTPGDATVFQSRNLLHSVCVFAGKKWDHKSIVENYNLTLKNLKRYYGH